MADLRLQACCQQHLSAAGGEMVKSEIACSCMWHVVLLQPKALAPALKQSLWLPARGSRPQFGFVVNIGKYMDEMQLP